jgi:hypothetical protein
VQDKNKCSGVQVQHPELSTSALDGGGWSPSHSGRFTLGGRAPVTEQEAGWASRACVDALEDEESLLQCFAANSSVSSM